MFVRVSQEHCPLYLLSRGGILELQPHGQGDPQVNHGRREQEQPGEKSGSAVGLPSHPCPRLCNPGTLPPAPGLLQREGEEAGCPDQPPEEPHDWKIQVGSNTSAVCSLLVSLGFEVGLTLDLAPPPAQPNRETT